MQPSAFGVGSHSTPDAIDRDLAAAESMERHRQLRRRVLNVVCIVIEFAVMVGAFLLIIHAQSPR